MPAKRIVTSVGLLLLACGAGSLQKGQITEQGAVLEMQSDGGAGGMGDVVGLAMLPDSSIVVGDAANAQLVRIASNGTVIARVGKRGASPGEFSRLQWVGSCAHVLTVHDIALSRLSMYNDAMAVSGARSIPKAFDSRDVAGCLADGRVLILNDSLPRPSEGVTRRRLAIAAFDTRTGRADTLRVFNGNEYNYVRRLGTSVAMPLGARTLVSIAANGIVVAESDRDMLWRYDQGSWRSVSLEGIPSAQRPSATDNERARLALSWAPRTAQDRAFAPALLAATPTAAQSPRIDGLVSADNGAVWVGFMPAADGQREWTQYDTTGKRTATTHLLWTFEPRMVKGNSWWGVQRDSIGVESVVRYRVGN